jgi:Heparinase II/III-like protein
MPWRTWFPDSGVLICRPGPDAQTPFAVAIKGGNNGVNHGHNDVGSFSVVAGTNMVICDPGGEVYTRRTFSAHRYDSEVLNSFGHAVPIVAGQLQRNGREARAVVLSTNLTDDADSIVFDLRSAYPIRDLEKLERSFDFQRGPAPSLVVRDVVRFVAPENFESALITWGKVQQMGENELEISDGGGAVTVEIDTQGHPYHLRQETINEDTENGRKPVHLGIVLDDKISEATVTLKISPVKDN